MAIAGKLFSDKKPRPDLERTKKTMGMSDKISQFFKLKDHEVKGKGPSASERLVEGVKKREGTEEWRTPNEKTTRFPEIRKGLNKLKSAIGKEGYNEKGQTQGDTCVSFVKGECKKANVDFMDTYNTRDFVQDQQAKGKGHGRLKAKPGDFVVFSRKDQSSKTHDDWTGKGPRPTHIGIKGEGRNEYTGSSSGTVETKGIYRGPKHRDGSTRKYKKTYYTPENKYKVED
jgi:hypothetical protein